VGPELVDNAAAAELAAGAEAGGEVVLVIRHGRTSRDALRRAAQLLREAGAAVGGVVVIAGDERARDSVWR
jgi:Mrp family chromosome partitioning ATPase